jgi:hypothetical protein
MLALTVLTVTAQRRITPVTPAATAGKATAAATDTASVVDPSRLVHYHDAQGNVVTVDTVTGAEVADTVATRQVKTGMTFPLLHSVSVGVNIWDPVMRIFGQHYGLIDFSAGVNLHNRYRPTLEIGVGSASHTPDDGNFTYKGKLAPYFKIGLDYNFFYNSTAPYELYAGARFGLTRMSYEIDNVELSSGYWDETSRFDIPSQSLTASWLELLVGIKVNIWRGLSMGWTLRYHSLLSDGNPAYGKPWYIPGFGTRGSTWAGSFSIYYTLPLNKRRPAVVDSEPQSSAEALPAPSTSTR